VKEVLRGVRAAPLPLPCDRACTGAPNLQTSGFSQNRPRISGFPTERRALLCTKVGNCGSHIVRRRVISVTSYVVVLMIVPPPGAKPKHLACYWLLLLLMILQMSKLLRTVYLCGNLQEIHMEQHGLQLRQCGRTSCSTGATQMCSVPMSGPHSSNLQALAHLFTRLRKSVYAFLFSAEKT
jgi:hypothetical protein